MSFFVLRKTFLLNKNYGLSAAEKCFLLICANFSNDDGRCFPSISRLMEETCLSRNTLIKVRKSLIQKGFLEYTGVYKGKQNQIKEMRLLYPTELTNTKIDTGEKLTSIKIGMGTSTKIATGTHTKIGTHNLSIEPINRNTTTTNTAIIDRKGDNTCLYNSKSKSSSCFFISELLKEIGLTIDHLNQLEKCDHLTIKSINQSLDHFEFDLAYNHKLTQIKKDPVAFFIGIMRKSGFYAPPSNFKSKKEKDEELVKEKKKLYYDSLKSILWDNYVDTRNEIIKKSFVKESKSSQATIIQRTLPNIETDSQWGVYNTFFNEKGIFHHQVWKLFCENTKQKWFKDKQIWISWEEFADNYGKQIA